MRKAIVLALILFTINVATAAAAPGDTLWTRTYGGTSSDVAYSVQQTTDGGYIAAGLTGSLGDDFDFYLIKTDISGDTLWTRTYGGTYKVAFSVQQTTDGGYIIVGYNYSFSTSEHDYYLMKTDASGDTLWTRTYGGDSDDYAQSVQQTTDGGYIVAGHTESFGAGSSDYYLLKTDASGDTLWTRTYGGTSYEYAYSVQQTTDGGYIVTGHTESFGAGGDFYLIKTDDFGDTLWTRTYGGTNSEWAYSVQQTTDGGYIVTGSTGSFGAGNADFYLVKTDAFGDTVWTQTYGGTSSDCARSVQQTTDGGYIIAGHTHSFGAGADDFYLIRTNAFGDTLWTRTYGGTSSDIAFSVQQTIDGGYIVAGDTRSFGTGISDAYLVKVEGGQPVTINMTPDDDPVELCPGNYFLFTGHLTNDNPHPITTDVWLVVRDAGMTEYGPLRRWEDIEVPPDTTMDYYPVWLWVPHYAVPDGYDLIARSGDYSTLTVIDETSFPFAVLDCPLSDGPNIGWKAYGWGVDTPPDVNLIPTKVSLKGNYPNPFNATTTISVEIAQTGNTNLSVYNLMGQKIETLIDNKLKAGQHNITWNASTYSSGVYFYKLTTDGKIFTKRMTLLK
ncbi:MAG: T9SS type A sorting domain-containing protein [candidate division Zixibacteria bacterium]|nr:T9SS type A sorting domain-containing protein [candidate division Zixibacteria bacterium]